MAVEYLLGAADRERLGLGGEWMRWDVRDLTLDEAIALEDLLGWTPTELIGRQWLPVLDPETGLQKTEDGRAVWRPSPKAQKFILWCLCRRAGCQTPYDEFDVGYMAMGVRAAADDEGDGDPKETPTDGRSTRASKRGGKPRA